jgi:hypothetical protein
MKLNQLTAFLAVLLLAGCGKAPIGADNNAELAPSGSYAGTMNGIAATAILTNVGNTSFMGPITLADGTTAQLQAVILDSASGTHLGSVGNGSIPADFILVVDSSGPCGTWTFMDVNTEVTSNGIIGTIQAATTGCGLINSTLALSLVSKL